MRNSRATGHREPLNHATVALLRGLSTGAGLDHRLKGHHLKVKMIAGHRNVTGSHVEWHAIPLVAAAVARSPNVTNCPNCRICHSKPAGKPSVHIGCSLLFRLLLVSIL